MKRAIKIALLVIVVLIIVVAIPIASALLGRRSAEDGVEVNGVRIVKDGMVTVGVIPLTDSTVALIDAGNDQAGTAILAELTRRKLDGNAVAAIFITHGHPDHTGAIGLFPKAEVISMEREVGLLEGREGAHGPLPRLFPVSPTGVKVARALKDGEMVTLGQTQIRAFAIPGHTAGSAAYLVNEVLFLGDAADIGRSGEMQGAPWVFSDSQPEDRSSLVTLEKRLAAEHVPVKAIAFAHSGVLTDGLAPLTAFAGKNQ
jgi:glyoxylase-like metal-dependent hydrolase (beta-lactamase superfamily II)